MRSLIGYLFLFLSFQPEGVFLAWWLLQAITRVLIVKFVRSSFHKSFLKIRAIADHSLTEYGQSYK